MSIISHLKEEMTSWEDYAQHVDKNDLKAVRIAKVYQTYQKMLKENNALDFDDLIYKTVLLFRQISRCSGKISGKIPLYHGG